MSARALYTHHPVRVRVRVSAQLAIFCRYVISGMQLLFDSQFYKVGVRCMYVDYHINSNGELPYEYVYEEEKKTWKQ